MSDVEPEVDDDEIEAEYLEDDDDEGPPQPVSVGRNFQELPEGYVTLVGFSKVLQMPRKKGGRNVIVKSQVLYSTAKNTKSFPVETHVDGRQIINIEKGLEWWDAKEERKAARAAEAAAAEAEAEEDDE
jgi:hypothetical protein